VSDFDGVGSLAGHPFRQTLQLGPCRGVGKSWEDSSTLVPIFWNARTVVSESPSSMSTHSAPASTVLCNTSILISSEPEKCPPLLTGRLVTTTGRRLRSDKSGMHSSAASRERKRMAASSRHSSRSTAVLLRIAGIFPGKASVMHPHKAWGDFLSCRHQSLPCQGKINRSVEDLIVL